MRNTRKKYLFTLSNYFFNINNTYNTKDYEIYYYRFK